MDHSVQLRTHLAISVVLILSIGIVYSKVTGTYFCSFDDFNYIHRVVFSDAREPGRILTTPHYSTMKYRPLDRAITLLTYWIGGINPTAFRIRNLGFHSINALLVYYLGWQSFKSTRISAVGALMFGLHPLADQTVVGALWTNTMAHTAYLLAIVLFVAAVRSKRLQLLWLTGALVAAWLGTLTYDSTIVVLGLMTAYIVLPFLIRRERSVRARFLAVFGVAAALLLGSYFLLRMLFVSHGWGKAQSDLVSLTDLARNVVMYGAALLMPIDSVLAHEWLHTPLPPDVRLTPYLTIAIGLCALIIVAGLVRLVSWLMKSNSITKSSINWPSVAFLACGIIVPLLPVLALSSHASETYLYLAVAFYALLLSYGLDRLLFHRHRPALHTSYVIIVVALIGLSSAATWVKNLQVFRCGEIAHRIVTDLPDASLVEEMETVYFANVPGEPTTHQYGLYGLRGIDTIGNGVWASYAISSALQVHYRNEQIAGAIVEPEELVATCQSALPSEALCLWVHSDGRLEAVQP